MKYRGLIIAIIVLVIILILEAVGIFLTLRQAPREEPQILDGPTVNNVLPINTANVPAEPTESTEPAKQEEFKEKILIGTQRYQVTTGIAVPVGTFSETYEETWLVTATPGATENNITLIVSTDKPGDIPYNMFSVVEKDGSIYGTGFNYEDKTQGATFDCRGRLPVYLAVGTSNSAASLDCTMNGMPAFSFAGSATAGSEKDYTFNGKTYKARTITITGSFQGQVAEALEFTSAPGIGTLESKGSIGDLVFGQFLGVVAGEGTSKLIFSDTDQIWLP